MSKQLAISSGRGLDLSQQIADALPWRLLDGFRRVRAAMGDLSPAIGSGITVALVVLAWWPSFTAMWLRWYPAWTLPHLSPWERLTELPSYYNHGPLVPCVSAALAIRALRRSTARFCPSRGASVLGWLTLIGSSALHLAGVHAGVGFTSGFALIGLLCGICLLWGGWSLLRVLAAPIALLLFMVPLPMAWIAEWNLELRVVASRAAAWMLVHVIGLAVVIDGSTLHGLCLADGVVRPLPVEDACSGLRNIIALLWFAGAFVAVCRARGRWRVVLLAAALPLALLANLARLVLLAWATWSSWSSPLLERLAHDSGGVIVFLLAMLAMVGLERCAIARQRPTRRMRTSSRTTLPGRTSIVHLATLRPALFAVLALTGVMTWEGARSRTVVPTRVELSALVPSALRAQGGLLTGVDLPDDPGTASALAGGACLRRRFVNLRTGDRAEFLVTHADTGRHATHPPEVCLRGQGHRIVAHREVAFAFADGLTGKARELISQHGERQIVHVYVYRSGRRLMSSFTAQQGNLLLSSLLGRSRSGGLIQVSVPVREGVTAASELAMAVLSQTLPEVHRGLP